VGRENDTSTLLDRILDRRKRGTNARVVINLPIFDRNVEVDSNEDPFVLEIEILN
jgi:hypothetical protein